MGLLHLYKNNPTSGVADGTQVSEGDTELSPIEIGPLMATNNEESAALKLAIRCESGYVTGADTVIEISGTSAAKWALAPDNAGVAGTFGAYGASLTLASGIGATNTLFWAKAKATSGETAGSDTSVNFAWSCATISPV